MSSWPLFDATIARWLAWVPRAAGLADELKPKSFWLAGVWDVRFVADLQATIGAGALVEGMTVREWLETKGQKLLDAYGGSVELYRQVGAEWNPWYADLVFRNAVQSAYAGGRYSEMFSADTIDTEPFVKYNAIRDGRTRPTHRALQGRIFRKLDPEARRYFPPSDHNCRCFLTGATLAEIEDAGYRVTRGVDIPGLPQLTPSGQPILGLDGQPVNVGRPPVGWDVDRVDALVSPALMAA